MATTRKIRLPLSLTDLGNKEKRDRLTRIETKNKEKLSSETIYIDGIGITAELDFYKRFHYEIVGVLIYDTYFKTNSYSFRSMN